MAGARLSRTLRRRRTRTSTRARTPRRAANAVRRAQPTRTSRLWRKQPLARHRRHRSWSGQRRTTKRTSRRQIAAKARRQRTGRRERGAGRGACRFGIPRRRPRGPVRGEVAAPGGRVEHARRYAGLRGAAAAARSADATAGSPAEGGCGGASAAFPRRTDQGTAMSAPATAARHAPAAPPEREAPSRLEVAAKGAAPGVEQDGRSGSRDGSPPKARKRRKGGKRES